MGEEQKEDQPFVVRIGPVDVDIPRSLGFFGGIAAALAFDLIAPEIAIFAAAVPFVKLLKRKNASKPERAIAGIIEGAAKPVGGDAEATVRPSWVDEEKEKEEQEAAEAHGEDGAGAETRH
jgi:hypothetical protein